MSDTPRTDAIVVKADGNMWARLCRQLERELAAKNAATQGKLMPRAKTVENVVDQPAVAAPDADIEGRQFIDDMGKLAAQMPEETTLRTYIPDRIEQLERELEEVTERESINYKMSILNKEESEKQYERAEKAEAALAEAQKDAERYRWLKKKRAILLITGFFGNGCINKTIDDVEAAIDAAKNTTVQPPKT